MACAQYPLWQVFGDDLGYLVLNSVGEEFEEDTLLVARVILTG